MAAKTPLSLVREKFGEKTKLVETLEKLAGEDLWVSRTNKDKGLKHVSNAKLLRLHAIFTEVKAKFGTRDKLIDAIAVLEKRTKDAGYRDRLAAWPVPRLYDAYKSASKRAGGTPAATAAKKTAKKASAPAAATKAAKPAAAAKAAKPASARKASK